MTGPDRHPACKSDFIRTNQCSGVGGECLKITKLEKNISSVFHFLFSSVSDFKSTAVDKSFWWYGTVDTEELYNF